MKKGLPWPVVGRLAALTGVYAIEHPGPQQHSYTREEFLRAIARTSALPRKSARPTRKP